MDRPAAPGVDGAVPEHELPHPLHETNHLHDIRLQYATFAERASVGGCGTGGAAVSTDAEPLAPSGAAVASSCLSRRTGVIAP